MSARLSDVIDVLEAAYPPMLAQDWDSVGLVCGDPDDDVDSVTIAVDATVAVVDEVPDRGLLLAHHPLLLRGVDTVAASTAKGALLHRMIRTGRALFTAHTNADSAAPGVSDALADALGVTVEEVLAPAVGGQDNDKWVVFVPAGNADEVREAMFAAGAGHIGDYSHCSWGVAGTGQGHDEEPARAQHGPDDRKRSASGCGRWINQLLQAGQEVTARVPAGVGTSDPSAQAPARGRGGQSPATRRCGRPPRSRQTRRRRPAPRRQARR